MTEFKFGDFPSEPLNCNIPCPCTKCQTQRLAAEKDVEDVCAEKMSTEDKEKEEKEEKKLESTPGSRFANFLTEVVSILFFLVIGTAIFWITVTYYVIQIGIKIYYSDRNIHIAVFVLFCLLTLSITYSMLYRNPNRKKVESPRAQTGLVSTTFPYSLNTKKKSEHITLEPKDPVKFNESKITPDTPMKNKNITVTITDSEAKEIFRQSKLFAVPTEMKRPPALLVYLQNVILNNY